MDHTTVYPEGLNGHLMMTDSEIEDEEDEFAEAFENGEVFLTEENIAKYDDIKARTIG